MATSPQTARELPAEVCDLALRLGATGSSASGSVILKQRGVMRDRPASREMRFSAAEIISVRSSEVEWRAATGPFGCVSVVDALRNGQAQLDVRVLGAFWIARVRNSAAAAKGEVVRYLAELAWAPDAILHNSSLAWSVIDGRTLRVSAAEKAARGEVEFRLDQKGLISTVFARDRPRKEGKSFVERPWCGRFYDYRQHQDRWLPFAGEVGWILVSNCIN
ncbi:MAG: hypothetical protein JO007_16080 [Alphaproteobacteria bacterium]|nr:hypothetical protein [Alphaproteobacteria bacterium]